MSPEIYLSLAVEPALSLLPDEMRSDKARAMLVAIALQESRIKYRRQIRGPARGFLQFEAGGVWAVMRNSRTTMDAHRVLTTLEYPVERRSSNEIQKAIEHNDVLGAAFGRLLMWASPLPLPGPDEVHQGWHLYLDSWRPRRPHPDTWNRFYSEAWGAIA